MVSIKLFMSCFIAQDCVCTASKLLCFKSSDYCNETPYNPSKFSMDNVWTSNPTCANMTLEIPTSKTEHFKQTSYVRRLLIVMIYFIKRRTLFNSDDLFTVPA